jgi:hypothetical protein
VSQALLTDAAGFVRRPLDDKDRHIRRRKRVWVTLLRMSLPTGERPATEESKTLGMMQLALSWSGATRSAIALAAATSMESGPLGRGGGVLAMFTGDAASWAGPVRRPQMY